MHKLKKNIPNAITSANLFFGCLGIVFAFEQTLVSASVCIFIAAILDFFDGLAARLLNVTSNIGKDLDSLADAISFGVLPSVIVYRLLSFSTSEESLLPYLAFLLAVFSAVRLAKFNNDPRQAEYFIGVPTPTNAMVVAALPMALYYNNVFGDFLVGLNFLLAYILVMSYLLVSEMPLLSLKVKKISFSGENKYVMFLLIGALFLIVFFKFTSAIFILLLYLLLSKLKYKSSSL